MVIDAQETPQLRSLRLSVSFWSESYRAKRTKAV
jgi:hypothetical protein